MAMARLRRHRCRRRPFAAATTVSDACGGRRPRARVVVVSAVCVVIAVIVVIVVFVAVVFV